MKKLILLGISLIILGGCSSYSAKEGANLVTRSGTITKLEMSTWMYGTHILSNQERKTTTALSGDENLDFDKYQGKKVEVTGKLKEGYPIDGGPEYLEVQSIEVIKK